MDRATFSCSNADCGLRSNQAVRLHGGAMARPQFAAALYFEGGQGGMDLYQGDCLEVMKKIPEGSVDLVLTDPPYNIGIASWDKIDNYVDWSILWLLECQRVLKPNGVLYFWHNDMVQIAELLQAIRQRTDFEFVSFCIWDKGDTFRAKTWKNRDPDGKTSLRSWFNICEYCLHFFNAPKNADSSWRHTGLNRVDSNPECYKPLKDWYRAELVRLGITKGDVARKYVEVTGKKPFMLRHYWHDSQFEIPTKAVFEDVYETLGFKFIASNGRQGYEALRQEYEALRQEYETLRQEYEALRQGYEALRNYHRCDAMHCNIWHVPMIPSSKRYHVCQKPVSILERLIRVSSKSDGVVLDCFMGSGSTGVACANTGRDFIGIEMDPSCFEMARSRIEEARNQLTICPG